MALSYISRQLFGGTARISAAEIRSPTAATIRTNTQTINGVDQEEIFITVIKKHYRLF